MREGIRAFDRTSEEAVISAMLLGDEAVNVAERILGNGAAFRIKFYEMVYDAILALRDAGDIIDPANVAHLIDLEAIGKTRNEVYQWLLGWADIAEVWGIESVEYHAQRIKDFYELRRIDIDLRRVVNNNMTDAAELDDMYEELEAILGRRPDIVTPDIITVSGARELYRQYIKDIQRRKIKTGWPGVDNAIRGLVPGDVCLIFARTNVGKSALAQSMQMSIWERQQIKSIFFSMEMPVTSVFERMFSMMSGWSENDVEDIFLKGDDERVAKIEAYEEGVFFCDKPGLTLEQIETITESAEDIGVIFIDYMGLIKTVGRSFYERLSDVAKDLKTMAKALDKVIICIVQVNRKGGDGTIPITIDMGRDSGQIEEASDVILGMHKDEKEQGVMHLTVVKARRGRKGYSCKIGFWGDTPKIIELVEERDN